MPDESAAALVQSAVTRASQFGGKALPIAGDVMVMTLILWFFIAYLERWLVKVRVLPAVPILPLLPVMTTSR